MRDYARVAPQFWVGDTGRFIRSCGHETQVVALYLLTCPSANMIGLYYLPMVVLCHETGSSSEGASKALRSLSEGDFAHYDEPSETVWVVEMAKFQIGDALSKKDNRVKGILRELEQYRKSPFFQRFYDKYQTAFSLPVESFSEAPSKPLRRASGAPSKPGTGSGTGSGERRGESPSADADPSASTEEVAGSDAVAQLQTAWNELTPPSLPRWRETSAKRRRQAQAALRARPLDGASGWREVIGRISASPFCCGANDRGWRASPDWLLQPDVGAKVLEGKYDPAGAGPAQLPEPEEPKVPCAICESPVGTIGRNHVGDAVLCVVCAQKLEHERERPPDHDYREQRAFDKAWVAARRRSAA